MSSTYKHKKNMAVNPIKTTNFNANWGRGEFTCMHTKAEKAGAWWKASFKTEVTVTKV
jgi:hypothetical protein